LKYHIKNLFLTITKGKDNKNSKILSINKGKINDQYPSNKPKLSNHIKNNKFSVRSNYFQDKEEIFEHAIHHPVLQIRKWDYQHLETFSDSKIYADE